MSDLPSKEIVELNETVEAKAHENYFLGAPPEFAQPFRLEVKRIGSMSISIIQKADSVTFNRILGFGVGEPATEAMLDEAIAFFQSNDCKNYSAQVSQLAQPPQYPEWFAARGFVAGRNWAKMYRGTEPIPASTDLRIELIGKEWADAYASVVCNAFGTASVYQPLLKGIVGQPGWCHYLAFDGEKPVSAAAMFIDGDTAWLGFMSTLSTHRKRGAQCALFARCVDDGTARGCKWFFAETKEDTPQNPNPSYRNLLRCGFKVAYLQRAYYHQSPDNLTTKVGRTLFIARYNLKFEWQRLRNRGKQSIRVN